MDFTPIIPYLPFLSGLLVALIGAGVTILTMRLQSKKLKIDIATAQQQIIASKNSIAKDNADTLEKLASITATAAEELDKSLQKSITMRNLIEKVDNQNMLIVNQNRIIEKLTIDLSTEHAARVDLETSHNDLKIELEAERKERQTAVLQIEDLKSYSDEVIRKLTKRVRDLEAYIRNKHLPIPDSDISTEEADPNVKT